MATLEADITKAGVVRDLWVANPSANSLADATESTVPTTRVMPFFIEAVKPASILRPVAVESDAFEEIMALARRVYADLTDEQVDRVEEISLDRTTWNSPRDVG